METELLQITLISDTSKKKEKEKNQSRQVVPIHPFHNTYLAISLATNKKKKAGSHSYNSSIFLLTLDKSRINGVPYFQKRKKRDIMCLKTW